MIPVGLKGEGKKKIVTFARIVDGKIIRKEYKFVSRLTSSALVKRIFRNIPEWKKK